MFSTSPSTLAPSVREALIALAQTSVDTSWGVVTMIDAVQVREWT